MKTRAEKIFPFLMILLGGLRLLAERFPARLPFLRCLGGDHFGWIFWSLGIAGLLWLMLRQFSLTAREKKADGTGSGLQRFFINYGVEALILTLTAASLAILIRSGFFWDDAVNSTAYLAEKKDAVPTLQHVLDFMKKYLELGRINILSIYYYFYFYIENVSVYKALIILTILIDQLIFRNTLMEFGLSRSGARLGMLLIPLMLQTRAYQDPVSGFYSLMQVLTAEMLLCALFLHRWLRTGKRRYFWRSLIMYAIGLLTYEVCFPFLAMICLLIWCRRKNFLKAVRGSLPFVGTTLLMLAAVYLVRNLFFRVDYPGVAFNLEPAKVLRTALTQLAAGLPLSFYSAGSQAAVMGHSYPAEAFMNYDFLSFLRGIRLSDILILLGCGFVAGRIRNTDIRNREDSSLFSQLSFLVLGASFAVLPMITVAMSERYQGQLLPGLGYLPVYMQYYGIVILLLLLTLQFKPSAGKRAVCLAVFSVILLLDLQNNRAVTEIMNRGFYENRNAGEAALHGGILDFLPEDAVLIPVNDRRYIWESDWNERGLYTQFYGNNARHVPGLIGDEKLLRKEAEDALAGGAVPDEEGFVTLAPENVWLIAYNGWQEHGFARLGRLKKASVHTETFAIRDAETDEVLYFISGKYPEQTAVQYTAVDGEFKQIGAADQLRIRQSDHGLLCRLPESECIHFDALTPDPSVY